MATPTMPVAKPSPEASRAAVARPGANPLMPALLSSVLLWLAFPPAEWAPLAWFALVPLLTLVRSPRRAWQCFGAAWLGGLAFWLLAIYWVSTIDDTAWLAWLAMAAALSLGWPVFLLIARVGVRTLRLPLMLVAPVAWVATEYGRAHILSGFPWYYLAHSQYRAIPLIQIADLTGSLGLSLLLVAANACWVDLLSLPLFAPDRTGKARLRRPQVARLATVGIGLAATLAYGAIRLGGASFRDGPNLALLQSNYIQRYEMRLTADEILTGIVRLVEQARRATPRPDLIVWPETAYPYGFVRIDPKLTEAQLAEQYAQAKERRGGRDWKEQQATITQMLRAWVDRLRTPMLIGASTDDFGPAGFTRSNAAFLVRPDSAEIQGYAKMQLVPFGEYIPLIDLMPWLTVLTPYRGAGIPNLEPGPAPAWLDLDPYRLATVICFEDTVPHVVRRFFAEAPGDRHPDILINLTNDGWFHGTSEPDMHLAVSVFRSVENRVPLARAVNTGISALIDGNGRIVQRLPKLKEGVLNIRVPLDDREGLYSRAGDWLGRTCLAVGLGLIPLGWWRARRSRFAA